MKLDCPAIGKQFSAEEISALVVKLVNYDDVYHFFRRIYWFGFIFTFEYFFSFKGWLDEV